MTRWKLEEKRAIKDFEKVIKGNEAKILAIYQVAPYMRLDYSPEGLQKLLNSLADQAKEKKPIKSSEIDETIEKVNEGFIIALETIAHTLHRAADQIDKIKEDIATGNIRLQDAMKKRDMILEEIGKWKPEGKD